VEEKYRAQGVGKLLLGHLGRVAEGKGCERVEWMVHDVSTPPGAGSEDHELSMEVGFFLILRILGTS